MAKRSLSIIPVQDIYNLIQRTMNTFGVYNLKDKAVDCFIYDESNESKRRRDVTNL